MVRKPSEGPGRGIIALALLFTTSGILHFVFQDFLTAAIPEWIPNHGALVSLTGILELLGAAGLLLPPLREIAAWALIALLVAVFPVNIQMLASARALGGLDWAQVLLWLRLPLQPLLIWIVYRYGVARPRGPRGPRGPRSLGMAGTAV